MKNRAGWLAIIVLAIAIALMVFFILPNLHKGKEAASNTPAVSAPQPAAVALNQSADGSKTVRAKTAAPDKAEAIRKTLAKAKTSVDALETLFAGDKLPPVDAYNAARLTAMTALKALQAADPADVVDAALKSSLINAQKAASRALELLAELPDAPMDAADMVANIARVMRGEPEIAPAPKGTPRFDVLRVEKDGSTVIAGSTAPGATVDVIDGDKTIASAKATENGDFAIVLDKPLSPGDHAIDLKATTKDGKALSSRQEATISVPEQGKGDVLAMVTTPGEASRMITLPQEVGKDAAEASDAAAPSDAASPATAPADKTTPAPIQLQITAVELDGDQIFVAGMGPKNRDVTAYADNKLINSGTIDDKGHFVIDGTMHLEVGQHIVSVDLKDENGKVVLRASVPFNRPAGDQVAVAAPDKDLSANGGTSSGKAGNAPFDMTRDTLAKSFALLSNLFADGKTPQLDALAAARSALELALKSLSEFHPGNDVDAKTAAFMLEMGKNAQKALSALKQVTQGSASDMAQALPGLKPLVQAALQPMPQAETAVSMNEANPPTISQPPLEKSSNMVIIRRGDTLWQISRRVYGEGVRYTTIYLANADAIRNPDLIEPGQTFTVPDKALPQPEAEAIHRNWMLEHKLVVPKDQAPQP
ncbi:Ig-like domain-containing protein [Allorhizobium sp. BGMRC 0089]|uniref:Ig-like domain-containing protein n=1 Tax=Allorhizobium sonneratiae TaxID=2934936 RepID=UPI00203476CC|nr:Ig-like domain-containing protein [Allorhizobium sonneratiae]MCM2292003.1 Ig-like domain-containing protein [Allorhizobium sonneratiae]